MSRLRDLVESGHTLDKTTILAMLDMVDRLEQAEAQVARVRELHDDWQGYCTECDAKLPCPTLRALDGEPNE